MIILCDSCEIELALEQQCDHDPKNSKIFLVSVEGNKIFLAPVEENNKKNNDFKNEPDIQLRGVRG